MNIFDNKLNNQITSYSLAISNKEEFGYLNIKDMNWGKSYQFFSNEKSNSKYLQGTFSISLDKFCKELNLKPNYIKIDVDGNEQQIIEGMKVEIKRETSYRSTYRS